MNKYGFWSVKTSRSKEVNDCRCFCFCVKQGLLLPHMAKEWLSLDDGVLGFQAEMAVSALVLTLPCFSSSLSVSERVNNCMHDFSAKLKFNDSIGN